MERASTPPSLRVQPARGDWACTGCASAHLCLAARSTSKPPQEKGRESSHVCPCRRTKKMGLLLARARSEHGDTALLLSIKTVQTHRAHIMEKLGMHHRTELVKYAMRKGMIPTE